MHAGLAEIIAPEQQRLVRQLRRRIADPSIIIWEDRSRHRANCDRS